MDRYTARESANSNAVIRVCMDLKDFEKIYCDMVKAVYSYNELFEGMDFEDIDLSRFRFSIEFAGKYYFEYLGTKPVVEAIELTHLSCFVEGENDEDY